MNESDVVSDEGPVVGPVVGPEFGPDPGTVQDAILASATAQIAADGTGFGCIHCGRAPIRVSVFCTTDCRDVCLAQCGSSSALGT